MTAITLAPPLAPARAPARRPAGLAGATRLRTLAGWQRTDTLMAGDLVLDTAGALHELRALTRLQVPGRDVVRLARPGHAPLVVGAGQVIMVDDWRAQLLFGRAAIAPAGRLVDGSACLSGQPGAATLVQLRFDGPVVLGLGGVQARITPAG